MGVRHKWHHSQGHIPLRPFPNLFTFPNLVGGDDEGHSPDHRHGRHPQEERATELHKIERPLATDAPWGALKAQFPCDP